MNSYTEPNGMYGAIQVMALDYVFRLLTEAFGNKRNRAAQGVPRIVGATQVVVCPVEAAPAACGC